MIDSVIKVYDLSDNLSSYKVIYDDNTEIFVPIKEGNRHYKQILAWVDEGNEIGEPE